MAPHDSRWQAQATEHGTKYTAHAAFDEPKKLVAKVASNALGISVPDNVQVKPIGSGVVREAFIPVVPSVQLGERLGLPTEGYYYHFYNGRLVQEYNRKYLRDNTQRTAKDELNKTRITHTEFKPFVIADKPNLKDPA